MTVKEIFMNKIEEEYDDFLEMISGYEVGEIARESKYIAKVQAVYTHLTVHEPLSDEQMTYFLKIANPMQLIANQYNPSEEELYADLNMVCEDICENRLYASGCSNKVNELLRKMCEELEVSQNTGIIAEKEKNVFEWLVKIGDNISDRFAEELMQFENPIEVICSATKGNSTLRDVIDETTSYIENNDIFALPHKLCHENISKESKWRHEAINEITKILPRPDFKTTMRWLDFFRNIENDCGNINENNPYFDFINALNTIANEQGDEILQHLYDMGKEPSILASELVEAAKYLADGGNIDRVPELAESGFFDGPYEEMGIQSEEQGGMNLC